MKCGRVPCAEGCVPGWASPVAPANKHLGYETDPLQGNGHCHVTLKTMAFVKPSHMEWRASGGSCVMVNTINCMPTSMYSSSWNIFSGKSKGVRASNLPFIPSYRDAIWRKNNFSLCNFPNILFQIFFNGLVLVLCKAEMSSKVVTYEGIPPPANFVMCRPLYSTFYLHMFTGEPALKRKTFLHSARQSNYSNIEPTKVVCLSFSFLLGSPPSHEAALPHFFSPPAVHGRQPGYIESMLAASSRSFVGTFILISTKCLSLLWCYYLYIYI